MPSTVRRGFIAAVFALVVFHCFFTGLAGVGLLGPDEPRYASIAREMARSGDWVTPRLNGSPWFEKPALYYWAAAAGFRVFTTPEDAARVPSGIFALCAVLGLVVVARRFYGPATAFAAAFMLPATVAMTGFARAAATDMPFAASLTLTMVAGAFLLLEDHPAHTEAIAAAFGAALGLAVLAKGPAAILLAGGSAAVWAIATGNIRRSFRLFHPAGVVAFAVLALPWYALCAARNPGFLRIFLLEHNMERFLTNRYQHQQPFWFFVPVILLAVFPWTVLVVPALADGWRTLRGAEWRNSPGMYFAAWVLLPFVFFSASQSKLPGYILPAIPPLVLLLARPVTADPGSARDARHRRVLWISLAFVPVGIAPFVLTRVPNLAGSARAMLGIPGLAESLTLIGFALLTAALLVAGSIRMRRTTVSLGIAAFFFSFAVGIAANHALPLLDGTISARQLAQAARQEAGDTQVAVFELPRAWQYGAEFYLDRALPEWTPGGERPVWLLTSRHGLLELPRSGAGVEVAKGSYGPCTLVRIE